MSLTANAYGNFLGGNSPFLANYASIMATWGTLLKPGGRIAAYVRSTGAQDGEDHFASSGLLVTSINQGLLRCRAGQNDIVVCLPGHAETYSSSGAVWANLVAGAQIVSAGVPGLVSNPTLTLSNAGASIALSANDVSLIGFNIQSATAALTSAIVFTAQGCTLASNSIVCTAAGGANSLIQVTSAPNTGIFGNYIAQDSTSAIIAITGATSTDVLIVGNQIRQRQGTSGGVGISIANTAGISGMATDNRIGTKTNLGAGAINTLITYAGTNPVGTFFCFGNLGSDNSGSATANAGILIPTANADA